MKTSFTPGPWRVDDSGFIVARGQYREQVVAIVHNSDGYGQAEANARLIAVAPLLLDELIDAAEFIESGGNDASPQRRAIALALGEEVSA